MIDCVYRNWVIRPAAIMSLARRRRSAMGAVSLSGSRVLQSMDTVREHGEQLVDVSWQLQQLGAIS